MKRMKTTKQSAVIFFRDNQLPKREDVLSSLTDLQGKYTWQEEHELEGTMALSIEFAQANIGVSFFGAPLEERLYLPMLETAGLDETDVEAIKNHGSHARLVFMEEAEPIEPVERMGRVYRVAARLNSLDGLAVLAPGSGVFVIGITSEHVDKPLEAEVPPLDMWVTVEKKGDDVARSVGASVIGIPEVELEGVGILDAENTFTTVLDVLLYIRRIRRPFVEGEILHVGMQPWNWLAEESSKERMKFRRVALEEGES